MRFLISYDYKNYLSSVGNNENAIEIIDRFIGMPINGNDLDVKDDILSSLLCYYNKRYDSLNLHEITRLIDSLVRSDDLTEVLLYHISKDCSDSIFDPEGFYYRSIVNVISRLYYVLKRYFGFDSNAQIVSNLLHTIHPFATLTFSKKNMSFFFRDDQMIIKLMESLYQNENKRKEVYRLLYTLELLSDSTLVNQSEQYMSMVTKGGNSNICILPANPSNGIETTEIVLPPEEIVSLRVQCSATDKLKQSIKDALQKEFDKNSCENGDVLEKSTTRRAVRHFKIENESMLSKKIWLDYYFVCLDKLESEYTQEERNSVDLKCPYYYYYLLVDLCEPCEKYEFEGDFLLALVELAISKKCEKRQDLYIQMYQLNFIGKKAGFIAETEVFSKDEKRKEAMQALKEELLNGPKKDIAKELLSVNPSPNSDIVEKVIVFLSPLFEEKYLNGIENENFKKILCKILSIDSFAAELKKTEFGGNFKHFNLKLILNVIGLLSSEKGNRKDPLLKPRIANSICQDLISLWNLEKASNIHKYVLKYNDRVNDNWSRSWSLLTTELKKDILDTID